MLYTVALGLLGLLTFGSIARFIHNAVRSGGGDFVTGTVLTRIRAEYKDS
ncbi:MAG: hypothetical protein JWL71_4814 [Acidobacteria bacterium]|jgi:hypothetical protein|nr:hypothetical protein [Acidobacteriota bacterium]